MEMTISHPIAGLAGLDMTRYGSLLAQFAPKLIETQAENEAALDVALQLIHKGDENRSPEEDALLNLVSILIEQFEERHYPARKRKSQKSSSFNFLQ